MKVIDLINDIRNKKKVPKKIKIKKYVFELDEYAYKKNDSFETVYIDGCKFWLRNFCSYDFWLSDEVEIIEDKEIEEIKNHFVLGLDESLEQVIEWQKENNKIYEDKINELIKAVNELKKGK